MRRRLLVTVMVMVAMVLVGLGVPLALSDARTDTQRQFVDRLADTVRFASLAQRPLLENDPAALLAEMRRYDEVYGIAVAVVGRDGVTFASSRPWPWSSVSEPDRVRVALTGRRSEPYPALMPWDAGPMLLAEPVLVDGEVRGAAITVSPTEVLRQELLDEWLVLLSAGLVALGLAALAALPLVRWIMRPVQLLDSGLPRVADAVLSGRPAEPVGDGRGPAELRRLIGSFDKMAATVSQALAAQRAFVADASHQLRNPLTALRLRLNNLDSHVEPAAAEEHQAAMEEADRLADVLDGLLALAKAERTPTDVETIELDRALADRLDAWGVLAEHERLLLRRAGDVGLRALAPAGTVETVLDAVLDNAIKFGPPGSEIIVRTEPDGDDVLVSVRDHGPGLTADELERATDRFWRSPAHHNVEGSGLGLAIARSSARRSGGELSLQRPEGGGLRVLLRLPAAPARDDNQATPDPEGFIRSG